MSRTKPGTSCTTTTRNISRPAPSSRSMMFSSASSCSATLSAGPLSSAISSTQRRLQSTPQRVEEPATTDSFACCPVLDQSLRQVLLKRMLSRAFQLEGIDCERDTSPQIRKSDSELYFSRSGI